MKNPVENRGKGLAGVGCRERMVVIGFGEALSAPEVAWNLQDAGFRVAAFTRRGCRPPLRRLRNISLFEVTPPEENAFETVEQLRSALKRMKVDAVLPLDDASVWLCDAVSSGFDVPVAAPTGVHARLALDKRLQIKAAADAGFRVPATQEVQSSGDVRHIERFPVVLKPALAVREVGGKLRKGRMHVCAERGELKRAVGEWGRVSRCSCSRFCQARVRGCSVWRGPTACKTGAPIVVSG